MANNKTPFNFREFLNDFPKNYKDFWDDPSFGAKEFIGAGYDKLPTDIKLIIETGKMAAGKMGELPSEVMAYKNYLELVVSMFLKPGYLGVDHKTSDAFLGLLMDRDKHQTLMEKAVRGPKDKKNIYEEWGRIYQLVDTINAQEIDANKRAYIEGGQLVDDNGIPTGVNIREENALIPLTRSLATQLNNVEIENAEFLFHTELENLGYAVVGDSDAFIDRAQTSGLTEDSGNVFYTTIYNQVNDIGNSTTQEMDGFSSGINTRQQQGHIYASRINKMRAGIEKSGDEFVRIFEAAVGEITSEQAEYLKACVKAAGRSEATRSIVFSMENGEVRERESLVREILLQQAGAEVLLDQTDSENGANLLNALMGEIYQVKMAEVLVALKDIAQWEMENVEQAWDAMQSGDATYQDYNRAAANYNRQIVTFVDGIGNAGYGSVIRTQVREKIYAGEAGKIIPPAMGRGVLPLRTFGEEPRPDELAAAQAEREHAKNNYASANFVRGFPNWQEKRIGANKSLDMTFGHAVSQTIEEIRQSHTFIWVHEKADPETGNINTLAGQFKLTDSDPWTSLIDPDHAAKHGTTVGEHVQKTADSQKMDMAAREKEGAGGKKILKRPWWRAFKKIMQRMKEMSVMKMAKVQAMGFIERVRKFYEGAKGHEPGYDVNFAETTASGQIREVLESDLPDSAFTDDLIMMQPHISSQFDNDLVVLPKPAQSQEIKQEDGIVPSVPATDATEAVKEASKEEAGAMFPGAVIDELKKGFASIVNIMKEIPKETAKCIADLVND